MFSSIYPEGILCVSELVESGDRAGRFRNFWIDDREKAVEWALKLDAAGRTVFIAQGSFKEAFGEWHGRKADHTAKFKSFFLDIDCGEGKAYPSQKAGLNALLKFCKTAQLAIPSIVNSGNGLYAHWVLSKSIPAPLWHGVAKLLQSVVVKLEPGLDSDHIMADRARVLRPVGSTNRKKGGSKPVTLVHDAEEVDVTKFALSVRDAAARLKIEVATPKPDLAKGAEFLAGLDMGKPTSAHVIADKCSQIANIRESEGDVPEPVWYAAVGLLRFTVEAPDIIHDWSRGHSGYDSGSTDKKIAQHEKAGVGPTTCAKFSALSPTLCDNCKHIGRITSPVSLGYEAPKPMERVDGKTTYPDPPSGFTISEQGVFYNDGGEARCIYAYPLWVQSINSDFFGESFTLRHRLPHNGWKEVTAPSNKINEPKSFFSTMIDAHIGVVGADNRKLFMVYVDTFMAKLRANQKLATLSGQMGWQENDQHTDLDFVLGAEVFSPDGEVRNVGYSASAPEFVRQMRPVGDTGAWAGATDVFNRPGLEGLAFEFICAAFGAPLVKFTSYEGAMLSVVGASGLGKTLTSEYALTAWGPWNKLLLLERDTNNSLARRFGVYGSLPICIDEISNITPEATSNLAYQITQGRDKNRLTKNATERKDVQEWRTLAVVSSNHSLVDKLGLVKGDASAEINRIFEYEVLDGFTIEESTRIGAVINSNYGVAGREYVKWLAQNQHKHAESIKKLTSMLTDKVAARPDERFWLMTAAVGLYGGMIAHKLGISLVRVDRLVSWICDTLIMMRRVKVSEIFDCASFLGSFLDKYSGGVIVVRSYSPDGSFDAAPYRAPTRGLVARIEVEPKKLFVSAEGLRYALGLMQVSPRKFASLMKNNGLVSTSNRMPLGRGTIYQSPAQQVWEFDLANPALGYRTAGWVHDATDGQVPVSEFLPTPAKRAMLN